MKSNTTILLVGMKGSGKTTFLAALWHVVESGEIHTALVAESLGNDREYLNKIRVQWLDCMPAIRTLSAEFAPCRMMLRRKDSADVITLLVPDLSGEAFKAQWKDRRATIEYAQVAPSAAGCLLFIHPEGVRSPVRIGPATVDGETGAERELEPVAWSHELAPTQVQLVELLQFLLVLRDERPLSVGVVVSAWDLIENESQSPDGWVQSNLPLLSQYLNSRPELNVHYFGVSAQGGSLPKDSDRLAEIEIASRRIRVRNLNGTTSDLSTVIEWMEFEK